MSRRKGVSAEEKRKRVLDIFLETEEAYTLKEVEKIASKEKGVLGDVVKGIVEGLVSDGLVQTDKIGATNVYWQFPSQALLSRRLKVEKQQAELERARAELAAEQQRAAELQRGRDESEERREALARLAELRQQLDELDKRLAAFADSDPAVIDQLRKDSVVARDAANRWTDNLFLLREWARDKFGIDASAFNKGFSVPDDLDYLA